MTIVWVVHEQWNGESDESKNLGVFSNEIAVRKFIKKCFLTRKITLESIQESESTVDVALIDIHSVGSGLNRTLDGSYCKDTEDGYNMQDYYNIIAAQFEMDVE
jgi:hypothetical protein